MIGIVFEGVAADQVDIVDKRGHVAVLVLVYFVHHGRDVHWTLDDLRVIGDLLRIHRFQEDLCKSFLYNYWTKGESDFFSDNLDRII